MVKYCKCGCGGEIIPQKHHKRYGTPDYIHNHHAKHMRLKPPLKKGSDNFMWKGGKPKCIDCGETITYGCIRCLKCANSHKSGELNPNWRGGITPNYRIRSPEWYKIKKLVHSRDNWTCVKCGKNNKILHAHHIVPYRITKDNSFSNLITLCQLCHIKEEWKYYKTMGCSYVH